MKIHKVSMTGFGPYKDTTVVDFDEFSDDGLFVITGKTGAGKTSILDAITFALFGHVPRYGKVSDDSVRSKYVIDTDAETHVALEFSQGDKRYRVERKPAYTPLGKKTKRPQWAEIAEMTNGEVVVLESRLLGRVESKIQEIVRLNPQQFNQVILLAQGAFQEFLLADSSERRNLLRKLFDSVRFERYSADLESQAKALKNELAHSDTRLNTLFESLAHEGNTEVPQGLGESVESEIRLWVEQIAKERSEAKESAQIAADDINIAWNGADQSLKKAQATREKQDRLQAARSREVELREAAPEIERVRARVKRAQQAETVEVLIEASIDAETELANIAEARNRAEEAFHERCAGVETAAESLEAHISLLTGERATAAKDAEREIELDKLRAKRDSLSAAEKTADTELEKLEAEIEALKSRLTELEEQLKALSAQEVKLSELEKQFDIAERTALAAKNATDAQDKLTQALAEEIEAREKLLAAEQVLNELKRKQYSDYAGILAGRLIAGEPCTVCGSTKHPAPAVTSEHAITEDDVVAAENVAIEARNSVDAISETRSAFEARRDAFLEESGGIECDVAEAELADARTKRDEAKTAQDAHQRLTSDREKLNAQLVDFTEIRTAQVEKCATLRSTCAQADQQLALNEEALRVAKGEYESVAKRLAELDVDLEVSTTLRESLAATVVAEKVAAAAHNALKSALEKNSFANAQEAEEARISADELSMLVNTIETHDKSLAVVTETLHDQDLKDLPEELIDLAPSREKFAELSAARDEAQQKLGEASKTSESVHNLVKEIDIEFTKGGETRTNFDIVYRLSETIKGQGPNTRRMPLETFALAADLEDIVAAANVLLGKMTNGRFELRYSDERAKGQAQSGLAIEVNDAYNEETRSPESLSGGEKFQASLALALGLAEVVTSRNGGVRLDTLFIDEGFGALDEETLDEVLDTIDALREGGRTVGLISHVDQVKERINNHLNVVATPGGWSTLET